MKFLRWILLLVTLASVASAADINGTWKAVFTCPMEERPKMVSEMIFELKAAGGKLMGTAHMANWPGDATLRDGKIEGDHFSFTAIGNSPWWARGSGGEASGLPKLMFTGTVQGNDMQLTLLWDSVMIYGGPRTPRQYEMKGKKTSD